VLPNNFTAITPAAEAYIKKFADLGEELSIPVYMFSFADLTDGVEFDPRVFVFRLSAYKSTIRPQDIVVPTTARDFKEIPETEHDKRPLPVISFCGYAGFKTRFLWLKFLLKNALWDVKAIANPILKARKLGIYWRQKAMRALEQSPLVTTNFIVRRTFSGALRTIELPPEQARKEFIDSIVDADFVLAPKGDGNYSNRFLETLALGRIPVLIDTDTILPAEERINYEPVIVRVPMNHVSQSAEYIRTYYDSLSTEEWQKRQKLARELFHTELRQDVFFRNFFRADLKG
jgi:hypothetical protein